VGEVGIKSSNSLWPPNLSTIFASYSFLLPDDPAMAAGLSQTFWSMEDVHAV
jgi:hypothetical protein